MERGIVLRNIWFSYVKGKYVLRDVSVSIDRGLTLVMGHNASGKTTLLKIASCMYKPDKGKVLIDGLDFWSLSRNERDHLRRDVIYVHERSIMVKGSVLDNLICGLTLRGMEKREARREALRFVKDLGLEYLLRKRRKELSSGQLHLLALLRAFLLRPKFLLLDEPLVYLDYENSRIILKLIKEGIHHRTIVVATNNPYPLMEYASNGFILSKGSILVKGGIDTIMEHISNVLKRIP